jgi:phospholipid-binding lipoprotein MlaA
MNSTMKTKNIFMALFLCLAVMSTSGCASSRSPDDAMKSSAHLSDPIEPFNRAVFSFNNAVDTVFFEPVAKVYRFFVPDFARAGVQNFMRNLKTPVYAANNLLQGDFKGAGSDVARLAINTTAGIGGLIDVAADQGFPHQDEDFGQTLAVWGVGSGPYIVLPFFGPSTARDGVGMIPDMMADPVRIAFMNTDQEYLMYNRTIVNVIDSRSRLLEQVTDLKRNSIDYYASVRSIYEQRRVSLIRDEEPNQAAYGHYEDMEE